MAQKHCGSCGGFVDRGGRCGTRHCRNYRGAKPTAASPARPAPPDQARPGEAASGYDRTRDEAVEEPGTTPPAARPESREPERRLSFTEWTAAAVEALRTPLSRPTDSDRCPTCRQPLAATVPGALGFHLCRGEIADGVRHFFELITGLVGNC